jgi:hypothetical protein
MREGTNKTKFACFGKSGVRVGLREAAFFILPELLGRQPLNLHARLCSLASARASQVFCYWHTNKVQRS